MANDEMSVRPARRADVREAAAILARAFFKEAPFTWIQPDNTLRARTLPGFFEATLRHIYPIELGTELLVDRSSILCVAVWTPPGKWKAPLLSQLLSLPALIRAVGLSHFSEFGQRGQAVEQALHAAHPTEPHWYLAILGTDPDMQGKGVGTKLIRSGLERCDRDRLPAYLECLEPLVPYYQRFGFEPVSTIAMPEGVPDQVGMRRPTNVALE